ncbi:DUF4013 domain-containing protein [bacterium]|nr:DUF4013 domain-containing protein [bacterium]
MEKLRVKDSLLYCFRSDGWFTKFLAIVGLIFVPIIGWFAIIGYFLRITKRWIEENYEGLPNFSRFGDLIASGFFLFITMIIYSLPLFIFAFIPCLGNLLTTAYNIVLTLIVPYIISVIAMNGKISSEVFNFGEITKFVQENILNLLILLAVDIGIVIVFSILTFPFIGGGVILLMIDEGEKYLPFSIASFAIALIVSFFLVFWSSSVSYSLSGNIFGIWLRRRENNPTDENTENIQISDSTT